MGSSNLGSLPLSLKILSPIVGVSARLASSFYRSSGAETAVYRNGVGVMVIFDFRGGEGTQHSQRQWH